MTQVAGPAFRSVDRCGDDPHYAWSVSDSFLSSHQVCAGQTTPTLNKGRPVKASQLIARVLVDDRRNLLGGCEANGAVAQYAYGLATLRRNVSDGGSP